MSELHSKELRETKLQVLASKFSQLDKGGATKNKIEKQLAGALKFARQTHTVWLESAWPHKVSQAIYKFAFK